MRWLPLFLAACSAAPSDLAGVETDDTEPIIPPCAYPEGAVEPMAIGSVITPYSWPEAIDRRDDSRVALDLANVACAVDPVIDWSPFDVLLFVSIPAW
jgi:hypothetical protein